MPIARLLLPILSLLSHSLSLSLSSYSKASASSSLSLSVLHLALTGDFNAGAEVRVVRAMEVTHRAPRVVGVHVVVVVGRKLSSSSSSTSIECERIWRRSWRCHTNENLFPNRQKTLDFYYIIIFVRRRRREEDEGGKRELFLVIKKWHFKIFIKRDLHLLNPEVGHHHHLPPFGRNKWNGLLLLPLLLHFDVNGSVFRHRNWILMRGGGQHQHQQQQQHHRRRQLRNLTEGHNNGLRSPRRERFPHTFQRQWS